MTIFQFYYLYFPFGEDIKKDDYIIPTIENEKDMLVDTILGMVTDHHHFIADKLKEAVKKKHSDWIDILTYSHTVVGGSEWTDSGLDESFSRPLCLSKAITPDYPSLVNYNNHCFPLLLFRVISVHINALQQTLSVMEFELANSIITNVENHVNRSYATIETFEFDSELLKLKYTEIDLDTRQFKVFQVYQWNNEKSRGSKTLLNNNQNINANLSIDKSPMIDFDSLDYAERYNLASHKPESYFIDVKVKNGIKVVKVQSPLNKQSIVTAISKELSLPIESITNIYDTVNSIEIEEDHIFQIKILL
ncbi:hypothetical protein PPL_08572 [Heterostelium album PN500]|uniref:Uncharacterized protein n=1 Tax=Heterostelium pallidum (strain ATCC 26659 / Pp 5 / PN500) TaxID=670386 RepID=D3BJ47_HETP5|nr:hypothetical protein PPL_08572 [Heterostelium album PN500]EFA77927.1 hypothetical protein PPL_08572 [Heterostelium album PN500]|eukprot:XP_020430055.1 hypothetical protein PPL_08572 [Heterostelium album PN500]